MANWLLLGVIGILVVAVLAEVVLIFLARKNLQTCQNTQSPYCYEVTCGAGANVQNLPQCQSDPCYCFPSRTGSDGQTYCNFQPYTAQPRETN